VSSAAIASVISRSLSFPSVSRSTVFGIWRQPHCCFHPLMAMFATANGKVVGHLALACFRLINSTDGSRTIVTDENSFIIEFHRWIWSVRAEITVGNALPQMQGPRQRDGIRENCCRL
jgi:hypothetical protein